jgi:hypothetical protein
MIQMTEMTEMTEMTKPKEMTEMTKNEFAQRVHILKKSQDFAKLR